MADETNNEGILSKALTAVESFLDDRLEKAAKKPDSPASDDGVNVAQYETDNEDTLYRKSAYRDGSYSVGVVGYQEKTVRLSFQLLREMSKRDTVVSAIIQNYQNDVADFAKPAKAKYEKGFKIVPKNERKKIEEIIEELFGSELKGLEETSSMDENGNPIMGDQEEQNPAQMLEGQEDEQEQVEGTPKLDEEGNPVLDEQGNPIMVDAEGNVIEIQEESEDQENSENPDAEESLTGDQSENSDEEDEDKKKKFGKAEGDEFPPKKEASDRNQKDSLENGEDSEAEGDEDQANDDKVMVEAVEQENLSQREKERLAKEVLARRSIDDIEKIKQLVMDCGVMEDRSFEDRRWNFESMLRAIVRDSLTYDQYALERVSDKTGKLHHWVPVDSGTIRFATAALKMQRGQIANEFAYDILYPEKELESLQANDAIELDDAKLDADQYKWVQVIRGKIERAFTEQELCVGMRNPTTDIYSNGYSIPELEVLMNTISSHIFTENYNRMYFTQGFSAKGILHIKAALPRRKLEAFRIQWNHLLKGNKNTFQTPIVSGMEDIQWIPLTQNHSDMEFSNWMNYLIKVICSLYQIDPVEIGFGMKEEGGRGGSLGGDNTREKIQLSKEKGLKPLLTHLQTFINQYLVSQINPEYELQFVGLDDESQKEAIARQEKEVKFKKTVNEIRAEDDLPPLDGCDKLILDPNYMAWYQKSSPDAAAIMEENQELYGMTDPNNPPQENPFGEEGEEGSEDSKGKKPFPPKGKGKKPFPPKKGEKVQKSLVIEHYTISED